MLIVAGVCEWGKEFRLDQMTLDQTLTLWKSFVFAVAVNSEEEIPKGST